MEVLRWGCCDGRPDLADGCADEAHGTPLPAVARRPTGRRSQGRLAPRTFGSEIVWTFGSGIVFVIKNGLRWRDAPKAYGPHKTLYNRFVRWSRIGVFDRIFADLAAQAGEPDEVMIDATHLKAHRTSASLREGGHFARADLRFEAVRGMRRQGSSDHPAAERRPDQRLSRCGDHAAGVAELGEDPDRRQRLRRRPTS